MWNLSPSLKSVTCIPDDYLLHFCAVQTISKFVLLISAEHLVLAITIIANASFLPSLSFSDFPSNPKVKSLWFQVNSPNIADRLTVLSPLLLLLYWKVGLCPWRWKLSWIFHVKDFCRFYIDRHLFPQRFRDRDHLLLPPDWLYWSFSPAPSLPLSHTAENFMLCTSFFSQCLA